MKPHYYRKLVNEFAKKSERIIPTCRKRKKNNIPLFFNSVRIISFKQFRSDPKLPRLFLFPFNRSKTLLPFNHYFPKLLILTEHKHIFLLFPSTFHQNRYRLFRNLFDTAMFPNERYYYFHFRHSANQLFVLIERSSIISV